MLRRRFELGSPGDRKPLALQWPMRSRQAQERAEAKQPNLIHASDDALEHWFVAALAKQGLTVDAKEQHSSKARAETAPIQRGGGRFVTLACASSVFHNVGDRWPEAVDVAMLARYAKALANGAMQLAAADGL